MAQRAKTSKTNRKTKLMYTALVVATLYVIVATPQYALYTAPMLALPAAVYLYTPYRLVPTTTPTAPVRSVSNEIRDTISVFVVLVAGIAAVVISVAITGYILGSFGDAVNSTAVDQGQDLLEQTMSQFNVVPVLVGAIIIATLAITFIKKFWREWGA